MIPNVSNELKKDFIFVTPPSRTFKMHSNLMSISGMIDGIHAVEQTVFLILHVERFEWLIYSWNYGFEKKDLFGKPIEFCIPEIERRIREALLQDDRITAVENFKFDIKKKKVLASFTVVSTFGSLYSETEVDT